MAWELTSYVAQMAVPDVRAKRLLAMLSYVYSCVLSELIVSPLYLITELCAIRYEYLPHNEPHSSTSVGVIRPPGLELGASGDIGAMRCGAGRTGDERIPTM